MSKRCTHRARAATSIIHSLTKSNLGKAGVLMKQWQLVDGQDGDISRLKLVEAKTPSPGFGEVLIRVHAASLNYRDLLIAKGVPPTEHGRVPLSDGAGEVVAVGAGVLQWKSGDRVCGQFFRDWIG